MNYFYFLALVTRQNAYCYKKKINVVLRDITRNVLKIIKYGNLSVLTSGSPTYHAIYGIKVIKKSKNKKQFTNSRTNNKRMVREIKRSRR